MIATSTETETSTGRMATLLHKATQGLDGARVWQVLVYPAKSLVMNPLALSMGLWRARILFSRDRTRYLAFTLSESLLKLFYYIQAESLSLYGLRGTSPTMGGGRLPMRAFWYQSVAGLWMYRNLGGAASVVGAMAIYLLSHLMWLATGSVSIGHLGGVLVLAALSTNFIGNIFAKQNYNVFGWALVPALVWAMATGNFVVAALASIVIPPLSVTAYVALALLAFYETVVTLEARWMLCLIPGGVFFAGALIFVHLRALHELAATVKALLGFIGALPKPRFRRPSRILSATIITAVLALFPLVVLLRHGTLPMFTTAQTAGFALIPVGWFFVNQTRLIRIADPQSILILFLAASTAISIHSEDPWILACFWLVNSNAFIALLHLMQSEPQEAILRRLPDFTPFDVSPLVSAVGKFLSQVPAGAKVLLACRDPRGNYNELFAEHFPMSELLNYAAHRAELAIVPDFYSVGYFPDQHLWGTDAESVARNLRQMGGEFAVVPFPSGEKEEAILSWSAAGFELIDQLNFASLGIEIDQMVASKGLTSGWRLFRKGAAKTTEQP